MAAAAIEDSEVSYEDLADIEQDFEDVEVEIIKQQLKLTDPLYARREETVSKIPNFWPLVLEQAPPDIDQYIQPSDSAVLLSSLTSLSITHFEVSEPHGDPRSVCIRWEFAPNEHFEDSVLEKRFWYRRKADGWTGLVSEPVGIKWKSKEKDLTGGLLDMVIAAWEEEKKGAAAESKPAKKAADKKTIKLGEKQKALKKKIENTGMGGLSFFAWFGFIGMRVTAEESREAARIESEKREKRRKGVKVAENGDHKDADVDDEDELNLAYELEIFPDGDDLALAITDDLWPGAIKYFTQAQEAEVTMSDLDFESGDEENISDLDAAEDSEDDDADADAPPSKRQKSS